MHYFNWKSQTHSFNDSICDFQWVFQETPVKNCIMGMLVTCPNWDDDYLVGFAVDESIDKEFNESYK